MILLLLLLLLLVLLLLLIFPVRQHSLLQRALYYRPSYDRFRPSPSVMSKRLKQPTIIRSSLRIAMARFLMVTSQRNSKWNIGSGAPNERGQENMQFSANKSPYIRNGPRQDHGYNDGLIGSRIHAVDWYQNYRPWMTLNGRCALYCRKHAYFGAYCKNLNEDSKWQMVKMQANDSSFWKWKHIGVCGYSRGSSG